MAKRKQGVPFAYPCRAWEGSLFEPEPRPSRPAQDALAVELRNARGARMDLFCKDTHRPEFHQSETYLAKEDEEPARDVPGFVDGVMTQEEVSEEMQYRAGIDPDAALDDEGDESETLQAYLARLAEEAEGAIEAARRQADDAERRGDEEASEDEEATEGHARYGQGAECHPEEMEKEILPSHGTRLMIRRHRGRRAKELRLIDRIAA